MSKPMCFTASRMSELLAGGTGKTKWNYIFDLALKTIGADKDISTPAMKHGINNEFYALQIAKEKLNAYPNTNESGEQVYYPINEFCGATPDALGDGFVLDAKCQFYIHTYIEQRDKLPAKYHIQVQTQMMALKVEKGYLLNYLTKPEIWGDDDWNEYPFPVEDRYCFHEILPEIEIQDKILSETEKNFPYIGIGVEMLRDAVLLDDDEFFYSQFVGKERYLKLKDINWIENIRRVYRHKNDFYVIKK